jgi:uncharacterized damage-inducible protein DinB
LRRHSIQSKKNMLNFRKKATELELLIELISEVAEREPWHGKGVKTILSEVNPQIVFQKPSGQHSILELVWHMATWKEFCVSRLLNDGRNLGDFEELDWRELNHTDTALWRQGLNHYWNMHHLLMDLMLKQDNKILDTIVPGRKYNFRKLLNGICLHDTYHSGQIAYINKMLKNT